MWTIIGVVALIAGSVGLIVSLRRGRAIAKDEFGRRNAAGVLVYEDFEESLRAKRRKMVTQFIANASALGLFIGLMLTFFVGPVLDREFEQRAERRRLEAQIPAKAERLGDRCNAGDRSACREFCSLPGTAATCLENFGRADGPQ